jgi:hypothetical protein
MEYMLSGLSRLITMMVNYSAGAIQELVCWTYGITEGELVKSKRRTFNEPRVLWIFVRITTLKKYSSASSVVQYVKKKILKDRKFRKRVDKLSQQLIKNQPET